MLLPILAVGQNVGLGIGQQDDGLDGQLEDGMFVFGRRTSAREGKSLLNSFPFNNNGDDHAHNHDNGHEHAHVHDHNDDGR